MADLDFFDTNEDGLVDTNDDTNGDGQVDAEDTAYWDNGAGWQPIGSSRTSVFQARFEGNGHTIRHLFIDRDTDVVGLFGWVGLFCVIRHVGLIDGQVTGNNDVGGLVGSHGGEIHTSYATGRVAGRERVGGLVGDNDGGLIHGQLRHRAGGGQERVGGLVGSNDDTITASYATGRVSGRERVGGLVGSNGGAIHTSYATGRVAGRDDVGGLVGIVSPDSPIAASYWDTATSGQTSRSHGTGQTTTQLQTPTGYSGIYADWNVDLDGGGTTDDPWDFGTSSQYPALAVDFDGNGDATWQEFGHQLRAGPPLTVTTTDTGLMELSWDAVTPHWTPPPAVTYTVYRNANPTPVAEALPDPAYTDLAVTRGTTYTYQVAAVVNGGEATWSGLVTVTAPNQAPMFADTTTTRTIPENTPAGQNIGGRVTATDPDSDPLTYSLDGPDKDSFSITPSTGQLQTQAALDYETTASYTVTVSVRDNLAVDNTADMATDAEIPVTITVTDVNEAPAFDAGTAPPPAWPRTPQAGSPSASSPPQTRTP